MALDLRGPFHSMILAFGVNISLERDLTTFSDLANDVATKQVQKTTGSMVADSQGRRRWSTGAVLGSLELSRVTFWLLSARGLAFEPKVGDRLVFGGRTYGLSAVDPEVGPDGSIYGYYVVALR